MSNNVIQTLDKSAFGELSVAELTAEVQIQFPYGINSEIVRVKDNNGTTSVIDNMINLSTGAQTDATAEINSTVPLKYHPGQGALVRFTALFTTGVVNSTQIAGIGNTADGLFFGYNGADFGVARQHDGENPLQTLQVTTGAAGAETATITVNGVPLSVPLTNSSINEFSFN